MILAVDIGNTRVRAALVEKGEVVALARVPTDSPGLVSRFREAVARLADRAGRDRLRGAGISSVVPALEGPVSQVIDELGIPRSRVEATHNASIQVGYARPEELGPDRLANAVAAKDRFGAPCLVLDLGTALTLEVVDGGGILRSGAIFPGMDAAGQALRTSTARVDLVPGTPGPQGLLGDSTAAAVTAGLTQGYSALIEGLASRGRQALGLEAPALLTGGGMRRLPGPLSGVTARDPFLTLRGIALLTAVPNARGAGGEKSRHKGP